MTPLKKGRKAAPRKKRLPRKVAPAQAEPRAAQKTTLKAVPRTPVADISPEEQIVGAVFLGKVRGFASELGMMSLVLEAPLAAGDTIRVKGKETDLTQKIGRLEVEGESAQSAAPGDGVSVSVADQVFAGDAVYKL